MSTPSSNTSSTRRMSNVKASPATRAGHRTSGTGIPRTTLRMSTAKNSTVQPSYDFLTGAPSSPPQPLRESRNVLRQPSKADLIKSDPVNEQLRAEIKALQYELNSIKSDREVTALRHQSELVDAQRRAEEDGSKALTSISEARVATQKLENISKELREIQYQSTNEKHDLEQKLRRAQDRVRTLEEEVEESQVELSSQERQWNHRIGELEERSNTLQITCDRLREEAQEKSASLQAFQEQIQEKSTEIGRLENEIVRLKAQSGDSDTLGIIKRELSEQVAHIKKLESTNREQHNELKQFRKAHKSIEVVEEEKRVLESRIRMMDDLRRELSESHLQRQILEDEKKSWTSYLENESSVDGEKQFDSPEALARALVQERLEKVTLVEKLGNVEPELAEKDSLIKGLEEDLGRHKKEVEKLRKDDGGGDSKKLARIDRQRALAVKEVNFLRAQLQTFDTEETTFQAGNFDEQKTKRIQELESMVDQYRKEVLALNNDLAKVSSEPNTASSTGTKRTRSEEPEERLGQLSRKNRKLQEEVSKLNQTTKVLQNDLAAQKTLLASQTAIIRTRALELRSNPTSDHAAIKSATLSALKSENAALLAQLEGRSTTKSVPIQTLENARRDISDMEKTVADKEKRMLRLKQIWSSKSIEFREAVASVLGWKLDFMPNGRVRVTSNFYPSSADSEDGGEENSIIFDGENGTMKISGGPKSKFGLEIKEMIRFWVEGRKEIPCFLAACTLEFYEKTTRAARM